MRGLCVRPGCVRWRFPASGAGPHIDGPDPAIPMFTRVPPRVRIVSSWPATADSIPNTFVRQFWGERSLSFNTAGNSGARARCRHSIRPAITGHAPVAVSLRARQFRGKCPLPSALRPVISGRTPVAVSCASSNFGSNARWCRFHIRQFRGERPLPPVSRPAIPG